MQSLSSTTRKPQTKPQKDLLCDDCPAHLSNAQVAKRQGKMEKQSQTGGGQDVVSKQMGILDQKDVPEKTGRLSQLRSLVRAAVPA